MKGLNSNVEKHQTCSCETLKFHKAVLTEQSVMRAIELLSKDLTVLIIAHRLTTLSTCSEIVEIGNGEITITSASNSKARNPLPFTKENNHE